MSAPVWWAVPLTAVGVVVASHLPTMGARLAGVASVIGVVFALSWVHLRIARRSSRGDARMRALVDALPISTMLFGAEHELVAVNDRARRLFGLGSRDERALPDLTDRDVEPAQIVASDTLLGAVRMASATKRHVTVEATIAEHNVVAVAAPFDNATVLLLRDRTEQSNTEKLRRDFVTNASHELKSPVAGIQALADALVTVAEAGNTSKVAELAERVSDESQRLGRLVSDLITLRRLEAHGTYTQAPVDLVALVHEVIADQLQHAERQGVALACDANGVATVAGDEPSLRQVVNNLVVNALHYTQDGGRVDVSVTDHGGVAHVISVQDTGIGIPPEDLDRVFERFYRVDEGRARTAGGTGLGLSIVRNTVAQHGGAVTVDSTVGVGSTFSVALPALQSDGMTQTASIGTSDQK